MKIPHYPAAALLAVAAVSLNAQTTWDFEATPDQNWSSFTNWNTDASPAGNAVVFGATGTTANATTVGNIVDQDFLISSLTYNSTASWQVTEIGSGRTLTVAGALLVGGQSGNTSTLATRTAFTGAGSLVVNDAASTLTVANTSTGSGGVPATVLDLSNLSTFTATVDAFNYGTGSGGTGTVYLANNSAITASTLTGGGTGTYTSWSNTVSNRLVLGSTTVLNVDTIAFASNRTQGSVGFRAADSGAANAAAAASPSLTIRGQTGGDSRAALSVGNIAEGGILNTNSNTRESVADFSAGSVDARLSTLTVGRAQRGLNGTGSYTGTMILGEGDIDATAVIISEQTGNTGDGASTASLTGHLDISAGNFTAGSILLANSLANVNSSVAGILEVSGTAQVNVTDDVTLARRTNAASANVIGATVNIDGGRLTVGGNLVEGTNANANAISSTVNVSGGVLDMTGGSVAVDNFNLTGGALLNVGAFTGDLHVQNDASFGFDAIDVSFTAASLTGTFTLGLEADLSITLADGFTPGASLLLVANDGVDSISGTFFSVNGVSLGGGDTFTLVNDTGTYTATLLYAAGDGNDLGVNLSLANIPEPATASVLAGVFTLGLGLTRRRR